MASSFLKNQNPKSLILKIFPTYLQFTYDQSDNAKLLKIQEKISQIYLHSEKAFKQNSMTFFLQKKSEWPLRKYRRNVFLVSLSFKKFTKIQITKNFKNFTNPVFYSSPFFFFPSRAFFFSFFKDLRNEGR